MNKNVLILFLSILGLSCNSNDDNSEMINIESTLIAKDNLFGSGEEGIVKQNTVITNQANWENLVTKMNLVNNVSNNFTEVDIDFSKYSVIVVFDEVIGHGGVFIELDIMVNSENIIINKTITSPEGSVASVMTQPFHIVKITKSDLPIIFK